MNIAAIVGARPDFVKASIVSRGLRAHSIDEVIIHTGQHCDEDLSDIIFPHLDIEAPTVNLKIRSGPHGAQTGRMLEQIEGVLLALAGRPDMVITYGDADSTLAGALAAAKLRIPVAHVEAGLRSFDKTMPEEINRVLTDHASDLLFAPAKTAAENLRSEGIPEAKIHAVGDVMYDAALFYGARAERKSRILANLNLRPGEFVLVTVHRPENTENDERLESVFHGLVQIAKELPIVLPLHPRTKASLLKKGILSHVSASLHVIPPLGYLDMMKLEKNARLIVTDSGGVQKEAFFYQVPCVTLREQTEWLELVDMGWNKIAPPTSSSRVAESVHEALLWTPPPCENPFGDGRSAERIVSIIQDWVGGGVVPTSLVLVED